MGHELKSTLLHFIDSIDSIVNIRRQQVQPVGLFHKNQHSVVVNPSNLSAVAAEGTQCNDAVGADFHWFI